MKTGQFFVREIEEGGRKIPVLFPAGDSAEKEIRGLTGQLFTVSLDDEAPLNDRQRAFLFAFTRDWIASLPDPVRRMFWKFFHAHNYAPVETKTVIDTLKSMYGIKSIATNKCTREQLSAFVEWATQRMDEIGAAAQNVREGE